MSQTGTSPLLERNPVTHAKHRREVFWQITLPVLVGVFVVLALSGLVVGIGAAPDQRQWADVSLIWMIVPTMFVSLIFLLVLIGGTYLLVRLIQALPPYARRLQDFFYMIRSQVGKIGDRVVEPVLRWHSFTASAKTLGRKVRRS
jgi:hypothetical protein